MEKTKQNLAGIINKLSRAEMKNIMGGMEDTYTYTDNNPTTHGTPGVGCYVTCDATVSVNGGAPTPVSGGLPCATYAVC